MRVSNVSMDEDICKMHSCLRDTMRLSRWAGVFPVEGLNKRDTGHLRFNMKSFYTLYYLSTISLLTVITGFMIHRFLTNQLNLIILSNVVFYVTGLLSAIFLLKLACEWPGLVRKAEAIERRIAEIYPRKIKPVKFYTITYIVLILAAIEHALSLAHKIINVMVCDQKTIFERSIFEYLFHVSFAFEYVSRNLFTLIICTITNIQATFLWNFTDVMTMCFSMYLISYFESLNKIINSQRKKKTHSWEHLRYYYSQLVALVQAVDSKMCYLILLSVFTNLFFICLQLYNTLNSGFTAKADCVSQYRKELKNIDKNIRVVYFSYSCLFLVIRAFIMFSLATKVNTVAQEPKYALSSVSSEEYTIHVQRFNRQLRYTTTALSGLFFYITRGMILKVFATIITYELVLLQFNYKK